MQAAVMDLEPEFFSFGRFSIYIEIDDFSAVQIHPGSLNVDDPIRIVGAGHSRILGNQCDETFLQFGDNH